MDAHRIDAGPVVRSTHRGTLILETENARRMMRRLGNLVRMEREESDQLPEEGPAEQVPDDEGGEGDARPEADENEPADDDGQATGHPPNAG
jgi:hypothetical protein